MTTTKSIAINNDLNAVLEKARTVVNDKAFFEVVLWRLPAPVLGSIDPFKYRLALVVEGECVLRYDNERGKGDHRHIGGLEEKIEFTDLETLFDAFQADMERILA
ncbi:toxin-antitoxin system TumE family protein [Rhizobium tumorigenes]|uniref:toxin-antitoxin system TumE family protein n=1 Tax=Rhizobium tumorigenes TaxID=2041385 RepID=UPI003C7BC978